MLKNSELFFRAALKFQNERQHISEEYENAMKGLESTKGSEYYKAETDRLKKERDNRLSALKQSSGADMLSTIETMRKTATQRATIAPTDEQVRILQVLKMRDNVTERELTEAAKSLENCPLGLSVIQEIANKNGVIRNFKRLYKGDKMPSEFASSALDTLEYETKDFLAYDTKRTARIAAQYQSNRYGQDESRPLPKRALFDEKADCFKSLGITPDNLDGFIAAVDGD